MGKKDDDQSSPFLEEYFRSRERDLIVDILRNEPDETVLAPSGEPADTPQDRKDAAPLPNAPRQWTRETIGKLTKNDIAKLPLVDLAAVLNFEG